MDSYSHKYGQSTFHFVLVTKCRYKMFRDREHKYLASDILNQVAKKHNMQILSLGIGDDHIHLVVTLHPMLSPSKAFQLLKGASAFALFRAIPNFRKRYPRGAFWGRNGTFRSIGDVDIKTVVQYSDHHNQTEITHFISPKICGL